MKGVPWRGPLEGSHGRFPWRAPVEGSRGWVPWGVAASLFMTVPTPPSAAPHQPLLPNRSSSAASLCGSESAASLRCAAPSNAPS